MAATEVNMSVEEMNAVKEQEIQLLQMITRALSLKCSAGAQITLEMVSQVMAPEVLLMKRQIRLRDEQLSNMTAEKCMAEAAKLEAEAALKDVVKEVVSVESG